MVILLFYGCLLTGFLSLAAGLDFQYATIDHNSEIRYDFPVDVASDHKRTFEMDFKTKQDHFFLFYFGYFQYNNSKPSQFLAAFIENGMFHVILSIPNTINPTVYSRNMFCESVYKRCSDNKFHSIVITYSKGEILLSLDGKTVQFDTVPVLRNSSIAEIVIASSPTPFELYRNTYASESKQLHTFRGCLSKVLLEQNNVKINIVEMVAKNVYKFKSKGQLYMNKCVDLFPLVPVTFHSSSDYLQIPGPKSFIIGKVLIIFRSLKPNCQLVYNPSDTPLYFNNIEIRDSKLFVYIMRGRELFGDFISNTNVSNGEDHRLEIVSQKNFSAVTIDGVQSLVNFSADAVVSSSWGEWFLGAMPKEHFLALPSKIWSAWLREFFSGCITKVRLNEEDIQLDLLVYTNSSIKPGCQTLKEVQDLNLCANKPCNEGLCHTDWDRVQCDCSDSNFTQPTCSKEATVAEFNGYQFMRITLRTQYQSEVEDISVRFLSKLPNGLILSTASQFAGTMDTLQIFMTNGNIYLLLNFGHGNKKFKTNENCFDGKWHSLKIKRRRRNLKMWIDGTLYQFNFESTHDGLSNDLLELGRINQSNNDRFVGYMVHFMFNGVNYFELAKDTAPMNVEVTASLARTNHINQFPVHFQTPQSYLLISKVNIFGEFRLEFMLKTNQPSGLVLLLKGDSGDYLFLEMVDRLLHIVYNWGSGYKRKASESGPLNDNDWHSVKIVRHQSKSHAYAFRVDGFPEGDRADVPVERGGINFNHFGRMYLGGYRENESIVMFDNETPRSKDGFQGCIASFYINNSMSTEPDIIYKDLLQEASARNDVVENCPNLQFSDGIKCSESYCGFGGVCVQQWRTISCDCAMTSFTGHTCKDPSTTVHFQKQPAYIVFRFIAAQNHTVDKLSLGFQTSSVNEASLISIMDGEMKQEVLSVRIKISEDRGFIEVAYKLDGKSYEMLEIRRNVVDGMYHIIRFTRQGRRATLQIDNLSPRIYSPDGLYRSKQFLEYSTVILGSKLNEKGNSFQGYISGLNLNGIPLTDIVKNHVEPNTQLVNKSNIILFPSFVPRLRDRSSLSLRQSEEEAKTPKTNPSENRIVVAKLNCSGINEDEKTQCQFSNPKVLVKPGIIYRKTDKKPDNKEILSSQSASVLSTVSPFDLDSGNRLTVSDLTIYPSINSPNRRNTNDNVNINLWLIIAFSSVGAFLLVALSCLIYRCSTKDEGSYNVEEDRVCIQTRDKSVKLNLKTLNDDKINERLLSNGAGKKSKTKRRCGDAKEWYV